jgi:hypothetical protein
VSEQGAAGHVALRHEKEVVAAKHADEVSAAAIGVGKQGPASETRRSSEPGVNVGCYIRGRPSIYKPDHRLYRGPLNGRDASKTQPAQVD